MAHFARLDENDIVTQVIVVDSNDLIKRSWWDPGGLFTGKEESERVGISFCQNHVNDSTSQWKMTYFWSKGEGFRGNYAGIGYSYMKDVKTLGVASTDVFMPPSPYPSWRIGINTAVWYPPEYPGEPPRLEDDRFRIEWSEENYNKDPSTAWVIRAYK